MRAFLSHLRKSSVHKVFLVALMTLVVLASWPARISATSRAPEIVEFGPSFRSLLGDIMIGPDDAIWAAESDGVVRLSRDGRFTQTRRPDDARYLQTDGIGIGPGNGIWLNGADRLLLFTRDAFRSFDIDESKAFGRPIGAFAAAPEGVYTGREAEPGVRLTTPDGRDRVLFADIGYVSRIARAPNGLLWISASQRHEPMTLVLGDRTGRRRTVAQQFFHLHRFDGGPSAAAPDGSLVATVEADDSDPTRPAQASLVRIEPNGAVREIMHCHTHIWHCGLGAIATARDGAVWATEPYTSGIVRIAADGAQREYREHLPDGATPTGITVDRDGSVWYTDGFRATIGHLWPADGHVRLFGNALTPLNNPGPAAITDDGSVWFRQTLTWHARITRLAPTGGVREYVDPFPQTCYVQRGVGCSTLRAAGDGVDFTTAFANQNAKGPQARHLRADGTMHDVSLDGCLKSETNIACFPHFAGHGVIPYYPTEKYSGAPNSVVLGPDGNLWFTDRDRSAIGRVTRTGHYAFFTRGLTRWDSGPQYITVGPDGALWFTEIRDRVGRITTDGRITEFSTGLPLRSGIGGIVTGPDGNVWFTLYHGNELARMTPAGVITRFRQGIFPSRGFDESTDSVPVVDRYGNIWFNEPQGGRIARATIPRPTPSANVGGGSDRSFAGVGQLFEELDGKPKRGGPIPARSTKT